MTRTLAGLGFALALAATGCSGGESGDTKKGTVSVTVTEGGAPKSGAHVIFHSKSGSVIEQLVTASDGTASFDGAHLDGMATVFAELTGGGGEIVSLAGLTDGDEFDVAVGDDGELGTAIAEPDVFFDGFAGAAEYVIDVGCSSDATISTNGNTAPIFGACVDAAGDADLFVTARSPGDVPLAYAFVEGFPAATTNSVLLPSWSTTFTDADVAFTGLPANAFAVLVDVQARGRAGSFGLLPDGSFAIVAAGAASSSVPVAQGFGTGFKRTHGVIFGTGINDLEGASVIFQEETAISADLTLPFATEFFPGLGPVTNGSGDPARPEVEWTDIDLPGIDVAIANADYDGADFWTWGFLVPPGMVDGSLRFPELPEELAAMLPAVDPGVRIVAADADFIDGFEEVKALQGLNLENPGVSPAKTKATIGGNIFNN